MLSVTIHPSELPYRIRAATVAALRRGRLPARLLYQSDGQASRWLAYHQAFSPSRTDLSVRDLYREVFRSTAQRLGAAAAGLSGVSSFAVISLGCGGGQKDRDFLDAAGFEMRAALHYAPLDTSPALVMEASQWVAARHPGVPVHPLVVDLESHPDLKAWIAERVPDDLPRVYCAFGLLPNLDPPVLLTYLRGLLRPQDLLLLSANQSPEGLDADGARILAQYDNPLARAWYLGALASLGLNPADLDLRIEAAGKSFDGSWWRIEVRAVPRKDLHVVLYGDLIRLGAGQPIQVFHSHRFTPEALRNQLAAAGLNLVEGSGPWQGARGEEGVYLLQGDPI